MKENYDFSNARRGSVVSPKGKTRITIWVDDPVLQTFRERAAVQGRGYQTVMNEALRTAADEQSLTLTALRQVIREEMAHP